MIIRPEAEADLVAAAQFYNEQRRGLGLEFVLCVEAVFEQIDRMPELYAESYKGVRRAVTKRFPYVVYYRVQDGEVVVLGVLHGSRNPQVWKRRARRK